MMGWRGCEHTPVDRRCPFWDTEGPKRRSWEPVNKGGWREGITLAALRMGRCVAGGAIAEQLCGPGLMGYLEARDTLIRGDG